MPTPSRITFPTAFEIALVAATLKLQPLNLSPHVTYSSVVKQALTLLRVAQTALTESEAANTDSSHDGVTITKL